MRLTIATKLLLGYVPLILLTVLLASFALVSLTRLNRITASIVEIDVPLVEAASQLADHLLAEDSYGRRYLLLRDGALADIFRQRREGFSRTLGRFRELRGAADPWAAAVEALHREYLALFEEGFAQPGNLRAEADRALRHRQAELLEALRSEAAALRQTRDDKTRRAAEIGTGAFRVTIVLCLLGVIIAGGTALAIARGITGAVHRLKTATTEIAEGRFDRVPQVAAGDEVSDLARAFAQMAEQLRRMEQMCLDASPLTRMPGGEAIAEVVQRRLDAGAPLAFCLLDLDNFKAYSDKYGYARGSDVIKALARTLEETVREQGSPADFLGHIGGDDFVLLTEPGKCRRLCSEILRRFDAAVPGFYDESDRARGFIHGKNRQGETMAFPLLSLSIAAVTDPDAGRRDSFSIGETAARLKERAKSVPGSALVTDRDGVEEAT